MKLIDNSVSEILNWFGSSMINKTMEGINSITHTMMNRARGYIDWTNTEPIFLKRSGLC